jgi:hypothetical protein
MPKHKSNTQKLADFVLVMLIAILIVTNPFIALVFGIGFVWGYISVEEINKWLTP